MIIESWFSFKPSYCLWNVVCSRWRIPWERRTGSSDSATSGVVAGVRVWYAKLLKRGGSFYVLWPRHRLYFGRSSCRDWRFEEMPRKPLSELWIGKFKTFILLLSEDMRHRSIAMPQQWSYGAVLPCTVWYRWIGGRGHERSPQGWILNPCLTCLGLVVQPTYDDVSKIIFETSRMLVLFSTKPIGLM